MAQITVVYWRDIPAQVIVKQGRTAAKRQLPERFEQADVVARVKQAVQVPVLGSGGIREAADIPRLLRESGADGVSIGRGCLGNPWIFRQARALLAGNPVGQPPTRAERGRVMRQLIEGEFRYYGPAVATRRLARTSCYFAKGLPDFAEFRGAVQRVRDLAGFRRLAAEFFR